MCPGPTLILQVRELCPNSVGDQRRQKHCLSTRHPTGIEMVSRIRLSVPQRHPCFESCGSPAVILKLAIYENVIDTLRELRRLFVGCLVDNC